MNTKKIALSTLHFTWKVIIFIFNLLFQVSKIAFAIAIIFVKFMFIFMFMFTIGICLSQSKRF